VEPTTLVKCWRRPADEPKPQTSTGERVYEGPIVSEWTDYLSDSGESFGEVDLDGSIRGFSTETLEPISLVTPDQFSEDFAGEEQSWVAGKDESWIISSASSTTWAQQRPSSHSTLSAKTSATSTGARTAGS